MYENGRLIRSPPKCMHRVLFGRLARPVTARTRLQNQCKSSTKAALYFSFIGWAEQGRRVGTLEPQTKIWGDASALRFDAKNIARALHKTGLPK